VRNKVRVFFLAAAVYPGGLSGCPVDGMGSGTDCVNGAICPSDELGRICLSQIIEIVCLFISSSDKQSQTKRVRPTEALVALPEGEENHFV